MMQISVISVQEIIPNFSYSISVYIVNFSTSSHFRSVIMSNCSSKFQFVDHAILSTVSVTQYVNHERGMALLASCTYCDVTVVSTVIVSCNASLHMRRVPGASATVHRNIIQSMLSVCDVTWVSSVQRLFSSCCAAVDSLCIIETTGVIQIVACRCPRCLLIDEQRQAPSLRTYRHRL